MSTIRSRRIFSANLQYYVEKSGKSQKDICDAMGMASSTFNDWMLAKNYPRIDMIERLARYFGITKSDLIEERTPTRTARTSQDDEMADVVLKMNTDEDFFKMVRALSKLDSEKRQAVRSLLNVLSKSYK